MLRRSRGRSTGLMGTRLEPESRPCAAAVCLLLEPAVVLRIDAREQLCRWRRILKRRTAPLGVFGQPAMHQAERGLGRVEPVTKKLERGSILAH